MKKLILSVSLCVVLVAADPYDDSLFFNSEEFDSSSLDEILSGLNITEIGEALRSDHPHINVNVTELIEMYNYTAETHVVATKDGYILEMHRIAGNIENPRPEGKQVVLLQHGLLSSSMDWVIAGPGKGFGFILADAGYDVWMGNARGNKFSRNHKNRKVSDDDYWNFSWHEIGVVDLPAMIDYVLQETGREKLFYAGHSQGTTSFLVMASELPEYNNKITAAFMLAPVGFCSKMFSPIFQGMAKFVNPLKNLFKLIGFHEIKPSDGFFKKFALRLCDDNSLLQPLCRSFLFMIAGFNKEQLDMKLLPAILAHVPAGSSVLQVAHYGQLINSGRFRQFDHGFIKNKKKYGSLTPPSYKISNIKAPVALHYSSNDWLSHVKDVDKLYSQLPNRIGKIHVPDTKFNHLDYLWGKDANSLLYSKVTSLMNRYKD